MALCECGCGYETRLAPENDASKGWVRGVPLRWVKGHNHRSSKPPYVIEDRGYVTPCWIWQRSKTWNGYGITCRNGKPVLAHVDYYQEKYGPIPDGLEADHLCRVRECCHPDHVEPVTHAENDQRGLQAKLTLDQVHQIRALWLILSGRINSKNHCKAKTLAKEYGVNKATIHDIVQRRTWTEV